MDPKWWILHLHILFVFSDQLPCVLCDLTYETDDMTMAFVNVTFKDPMTNAFHTEKSESGKFGVGKIDSAQGWVVHVKTKNGTNNFGCELPFENVRRHPKEPWIALIKRGQCTFNKKISNAAQSNASAVVVYDSKDGPLQKMHYRVPNIVGIFVSYEKGLEIAEIVDNGTDVLMYITVGTHHSVRYSNINRTSVLFVSISFIVLMIISLAWLVFYYVQRFRYIHAKDQLSKRLCSAAKKALAKIPTRSIKAGDKEAEGELECCAVCIEPYKVHDVVRILPCKHVFHKSCVDPWLLDQRTCPMCKMDILKFYGLVFTGSQESILQVELDAERDSDVFGGGSSSVDGGGPPAIPPRTPVVTGEVTSSGGQRMTVVPIHIPSSLLTPCHHQRDKNSDASSCDSCDPLHNSDTFEALHVFGNSQRVSSPEPEDESSQPEVRPPKYSLTNNN